MVIRAAIAVLLCSALALAASPLDEAQRQALGWQIALDREGFSPGLLDAKPGLKTTLATIEFQRSHGLEPTGKLDSPTLGLLNPPEPLADYLVSEGDLEMVTGPLPKSWIEKSKAKALGYESAGEALAERFHCSAALLSALNKGVDLSKVKAGQTIVAPAVAGGKSPHVDRLEINLSEKVIRCYSGQSPVVALFHCSIANDPAKRPSGSARVTGVTMEPAYNFDPVNWPEVKGIDQKLLIPPGPNNPVGRCWIALSLKGYGIHGTPVPEMIGKTGSHGCFRLANWDALRLGRMVTTGASVQFVSNTSIAKR